MTMVHHSLEMSQGSQNLCTTLKESCAQNQQMTAIEYISGTAEIVNASSSLFQHDGAGAFKLSERSTLPTAMSAEDLPGGGTQISNVRRIRRINCHRVQSDGNSALESILDNKYLLN